MSASHPSEADPKQFLDDAFVRAGGSYLTPRAQVWLLERLSKYEGNPVTREANNPAGLKCTLAGDHETHQGRCLYLESLRCIGAKPTYIARFNTPKEGARAAVLMAQRVAVEPGKAQAPHLQFPPSDNFANGWLEDNDVKTVAMLRADLAAFDVIGVGRVIAKNEFDSQVQGVREFIQEWEQCPSEECKKRLIERLSDVTSKANRVRTGMANINVGLNSGEEARIKELYERVKTHDKAVKSSVQAEGKYPEVEEYGNRWKIFVDQVKDLNDRANSTISWVWLSEIELAEQKFNFLAKELETVAAKVKVRKQAEQIDILQDAKKNLSALTPEQIQAAVDKSKEVSKVLIEQSAATLGPNPANIPNKPFSWNPFADANPMWKAKAVAVGTVGIVAVGVAGAGYIGAKLMFPGLFRN